MTRILLTGACGRLGRAILRQGAGRFEFVCVDRSPAVLDLGGIVCDLLDRDGLQRAAEGCDAIVHAAGRHGGDRDSATHAQFLETNVLGAESVYHAALAAKVPRVVNASTLTILYGKDWLGNGRSVVTEDSPTALEWIYPQSKFMAEQLGEFYARNHGLECVHLRFAWLRTVGIEQIGLGLLARSVTDSDAADAALAACVAPRLRNEVFLVGPDTPIQQTHIDAALLDPFDALEQLFPGVVPCLLRAGVRPRPEEFWPVARIDRAKLALNWRPRTTIETYLQSLGWSSPRAPIAAAEAAR